MKSFKPVVEVYGEEGHWASNALRFATRKEAMDNAAELASRWTMVKRYDAQESDDAPTHVWAHGQLSSLPKVESE